jgi:hypothetical protein
MALRVTLKAEGRLPLEIPANPYPMFPYMEALNCFSLDSATGHRHLFIEGPIRVNASISFKNLGYDFVVDYTRFLIDSIQFGKRPFRIICPSYIDFGNGKGVDIESAYYSGPPSLKDVITPRDDAGLFYDIELPYIFVRKNINV